MSTTIPQRDLRNHNAQIIERVSAGECFVVTRDGVPVADVIPHVQTGRPPMFPSAGQLDAFFTDVVVDAASWLAEIRDDAVDDELSDPWARRADG